jgi:hypothetical protein
MTWHEENSKLAGECIRHETPVLSTWYITCTGVWSTACTLFELYARYKYSLANVTVPGTTRRRLSYKFSLSRSPYTFRIELVHLDTELEHPNSRRSALLMNHMPFEPIGSRNSKKNGEMARMQRNRCTTNPWGTTFVAIILCMICATGGAFLVPQKVAPSMSVSTERRAFPNLWQQQKEDTNMDAIPFIIERLSDRPADHVFDEVAGMCIDVFFNKSRTNPA